MTSVRQFVHSLGVSTVATAALLIGGCNTVHQSSPDAGTMPSSTPSTPAMSSMPSMPATKPAGNSMTSSPAAPAPTPTAAAKDIRVKLGIDADYKDPKGNMWTAATDTVCDGTAQTRADDLAIAGTDDPGLYRSEKYDITKFSEKVPNGKYTVKMYFAETWAADSGGDITGPGGRVFNFKVGDQPEVQNFDIAKEAGAVQKAVVKTFQHVNVTDGTLTITFTPGVQSTECNAVEIISE